VAVIDSLDATGGDQGGTGESSEKFHFHIANNATENGPRVKHDSTRGFFATFIPARF
jgi:hypothetical protein